MASGPIRPRTGYPGLACDSRTRHPRQHRSYAKTALAEPYISSPRARPDSLVPPHADLAFPRIGALRATALVHHHLRQVPLDDIRVRAVVDERHGRELEGRAARLHAGQPVHLPVLLDHVGVVIEKRVRRPVTGRAVSSAVVGVVPAGEIGRISARALMS